MGWDVIVCSVILFGGPESRSTWRGFAFHPFVDSANTEFPHPFEHGMGDTMWGPVYDS